jgi:lipopolysaccharide transport system permease protein
MSKQIIDSKTRISIADFKELIDFKDLFLTLTYREYRVRYAQTVLGFLWVFIQPLATLIIFTYIFGKAIDVDTQNIPYPVFSMCGISIWTYFSFVVSQSGRALINSQSMIQKIYFPRLVLPISRGLIGLVDLFITLLILLILMLYYGVNPSLNLIYLPIFIAIAIVSALGVGIWISALTIRFRDFQHIIPFIVQIGLYATPVAYSSNYIPEKFYNLYYSINPMAGVVEGFRWCIIGTGSIRPEIYISIVIVFTIFITAIVYFKKIERKMGDII